MISSREVPENMFPLTIELVNHATGETVASDEVTGPGAYTKPEVPEGVDLAVRITFADGTVDYAPPLRGQT